MCWFLDHADTIIIGLMTLGVYISQKDIMRKQYNLSLLKERYEIYKEIKNILNSFTDANEISTMLIGVNIEKNNIIKSKIKYSELKEKVLILFGEDISKNISEMLSLLEKQTELIDAHNQLSIPRLIYHPDTREFLGVRVFTYENSITNHNLYYVDGKEKIFHSIYNKEDNENVIHWNKLTESEEECKRLYDEHMNKNKLITDNYDRIKNLLSYISEKLYNILIKN